MTKLLKISAKCLLVVMLLSVFSCQKDPLEFRNGASIQGTQTTNYTSFRKKMPNPYTLDNMRKALKGLSGKMKGNAANMVSGVHVEPNLLYIKFTPQTEEQFNKLDATELALIDYPLGYDYQEAFFENRPPLKEGEIRPHYTTVPVGTELPAGVPYEVLAEMYLPQRDKSLKEENSSFSYKPKNGKSTDFVGILLEQAWTQVGEQLQQKEKKSRTH